MVSPFRDFSNGIVFLKMGTGCNNGVLPSVEDLFYGLVRKLVLRPGSGPIVSPQADVKLTMTMCVNHVSGYGTGQALEVFSVEDQLRNVARIYEHTEDNPYIKSVSDIMPVGLQKAVLTMCTGEEAILWIDPLIAYGSVGLRYGGGAAEQIPPNTALIYKVRLVNWKTKEPLVETPNLNAGTLVIDDLLCQAQKQLLAEKRPLAIQSLTKAIGIIETMPIDSFLDPIQSSVQKQLLLYALKLASETAMQLGWYDFTVTCTRKALEIEPENVEATFLLGCAYFALGYNDIAKQNVRRAHLSNIVKREYKDKLDEINRHVSLIDPFESDEEYLEDYEQMANIIMAKRTSSRGHIIEKVIMLCKKQGNSGESDISICGGFSPDDLSDISTALQSQMGRELIVRQFRETVEVEFLYS